MPKKLCYPSTLNLHLNLTCSLISNQRTYVSNFSKGYDEGKAKWANDQIKKELYYILPKSNTSKGTTIVIPAVATGGGVSTGISFAALLLLGVIGLALSISGSSSETDRERQHTVYRALNEADVISLAAGEGIIAGNPDSSRTVLQHVLTNDSKNSPWTSTTKSLSVAQGYDSGYGIVAIDLRKVTSKVVYAPLEIADNDPI